ncbi:hydrolase, alpha/beta fold family protein [Besnoitia besnoiti]|uniref:Hydrolase, alpha/beta fold family protein n=1 Tax=Besnoitia besnoiti TaxID=94643 RepID=A0A2A9MLL7_BESBE|nr:hydrolase, alpha/beta fold family protein [Besnoitia besnoiti]PFH36360.1 hydrolase, alpha/beta fold family protein [Besnoitia besnoiti]
MKRRISSSRRLSSLRLAPLFLSRLFLLSLFLLLLRWPPVSGRVRPLPRHPLCRPAPSFRACVAANSKTLGPSAGPISSSSLMSSQLSLRGCVPRDALTMLGVQRASSVAAALASRRAPPPREVSCFLFEALHPIRNHATARGCAALPGEAFLARRHASAQASSCASRSCGGACAARPLASTSSSSCWPPSAASGAPTLTRSLSTLSASLSSCASPVAPLCVPLACAALRLSARCASVVSQPPSSSSSTPQGEAGAAPREAAETGESSFPDAADLAFHVIPSRVKPLRREAPSLCVLHGLLGSKRNMRSFAALLNSPQIVAMDLRNHGESPWRDAMSIADLGKDLLHMLDTKPSLFAPPSPSATASGSTTARAHSGVVLVGHSLGGLAAMFAALHRAQEGVSTRPPVIRGVVVLDIAPVDYSSPRARAEGRPARGEEGLSTRRVVEILCDLPMSAFEDKKQLARTLAATDSPLPPRMVQWLLTAVKERRASRMRSGEAPWLEQAPPSRSRDKTLKNDEKIVLEWEMNLHAIQHMLKTQQLRWPLECPHEGAEPSEASRTEARGGAPPPVFEGPTLFLKGANSSYVDLKRDWPAMRRFFPNAECKVVQNAGHWLHAEQPLQTAELVNDFLAKT